MLAERGLDEDHTTIWRWVQRYGPELEQRLRRHLKPTNNTSEIHSNGRLVHSTGATIDFLLFALHEPQEQPPTVSIRQHGV